MTHQLHIQMIIMPKKMH